MGFGIGVISDPTVTLSSAIRASVTGSYLPIGSKERRRTMLGEAFPHILTAARTGAEWAWTSIYRDLAPSVLGYLRAQGEREPEDLTGEVFLQVVRDLRGFDGGEREFRAWVFVIAHHRLLDARRWRARRPVEPTAEVPGAERFAGDVEEDALREIASERARRIIARLSPEQRSVLLLRLLGGLTVAEVAEAIGKSTGAVKALQRRGLAAVERAFVNEGVTL